MPTTNGHSAQIVRIPKVRYQWGTSLTTLVFSSYIEAGVEIKHFSLPTRVDCIEEYSAGHEKPDPFRFLVTPYKSKDEFSAARSDSQADEDLRNMFPSLIVTVSGRILPIDLYLSTTDLAIRQSWTNTHMTVSTMFDKSIEVSLGMTKGLIYYDVNGVDKFWMKPSTEGHKGFVFHGMSSELAEGGAWDETWRGSSAFSFSSLYNPSLPLEFSVNFEGEFGEDPALWAPTQGIRGFLIDVDIAASAGSLGYLDSGKGGWQVPELYLAAPRYFDQHMEDISGAIPFCNPASAWASAVDGVMVTPFNRGAFMRSSNDADLNFALGNLNGLVDGRPTQTDTLRSLLEEVRTALVAM